MEPYCKVLIPLLYSKFQFIMVVDNSSVLKITLISKHNATNIFLKTTVIIYKTRILEITLINKHNTTNIVFKTVQTMNVLNYKSK